MKGVAAQPETTCQHHRLAVEWSHSTGSYPGEPAIHRRFETQARETSDAIATVRGGERWSYRELNRRADRIAHSLRSSGAAAESRVGLCVERAPEMASAMLGILKAGAGFVPLDPGYPRERLDLMVKDARISIVLARDRHLETLVGLSAAVLSLEAGTGGWSPLGAEASRDTGLDAVAYVVYTSGSTGRPKGVAVSHANFMPLMHWARGYFGLGGHVRVLQTLSFGFDFGIFELLSTLLFGGTLFFPEREELRDLERYGQLAQQYAVNTIHATPSVFKQVAALGGRLDTVGIVHLGGEPIPRSTVEAVFGAAPNCHLFNGYGPTETTVNSNIYALRGLPAEMPADFELPIGRVTAASTVYVVGRRCRPVPAGEQGELVIGGAGVARGYLRRPALTAARFVPDPFGPTPGARLYRTGDRASFLPDGNVRFFGRFDHQIKIRGFRVELGEIESALGRHAAVQEAIVLAREDGEGRQQLVAYVASLPESRPSARQLRSYLRTRLPAYMVPSIYHLVDALPLTASGKVDRAALERLPELAFSEVPVSEEPSNLTANQSLFWFTHKLYEGRELYYDRTPVAFTIEGGLDPAHFRRALQRLVDRSDILRSRIVEVDGLPHREVRERLEVELDEVDLSRQASPSEAFEAWLELRRAKPMSLESRLLDFALVRLGPRRWVWYLNLFHILADAWSIYLIFRFAADNYRRSLEGTLAEAPELVPFQDFVDADLERQKSERYESARSYWREKLSRPLVPNRFYSTPGTEPTTETERRTVDLGVERSRAVAELVKSGGFFSPAVVFATVLFAYLHRLSGESRLRLGTPFASRPPRFRESIGLFMTVCPTEVEAADDETFLSLARKAQLEIGRSTRYEFYPVRNHAGHPAYDVHFNYQNIAFTDFCDMPASFKLLMAGRSNDRLNLQVRDFDGEGRFFLDFDFNRGAFDDEQSRRSVEHYLNLLDAMIADVETPLGRARLLSSRETERLLAASPSGADPWLPAARGDARLYILDRWSNLLPHGIAGEVFLAGVETATGSGFPNPFGAGELLRTGERARWLPDGRLERLGQVDPRGPVEEEPGDFVAPRTPLESRVAEIYGRVLGTDAVGVHDDFFDLGGNSILATRVVQALREEVSLRLPLRYVFDAPTVALLAEVVEQHRSEAVRGG